MNLAWYGFDGEVRSIGPDESQLVEVAEGDGMGDRKENPGVWMFHAVTERLATHLDRLSSWDELYGRDVEVDLWIRRIDTGRAKSISLLLGFANEAFESPTGERNLRLRVRTAN
jgi:hypothetical protein